MQFIVGALSYAGNYNADLSLTFMSLTIVPPLDRAFGEIKSCSFSEGWARLPGSRHEPFLKATHKLCLFFGADLTCGTQAPAVSS